MRRECRRGATFWKISPVLIAVALVVLPTAAGAQIDPSDTGAGTKLGLAQRNNSGQVGTVTLFAHGSDATLVVVRLASALPGRREPAMLYRGHSCDSFDTRRAYELAPVVGGVSRTIVELPPERVLSGNYVVDVRAPGGSSTDVSCGELHR